MREDADTVAIDVRSEFSKFNMQHYISLGLERARIYNLSRLLMACSNYSILSSKVIDPKDETSRITKIFVEIMLLAVGKHFSTCSGALSRGKNTRLHIRPKRKNYSWREKRGISIRRSMRGLPSAICGLIQSHPFWS